MDYLEEVVANRFKWKGMALSLFSQTKKIVGWRRVNALSNEKPIRDKTPQESRITVLHKANEGQISIGKRKKSPS